MDRKSPIGVFDSGLGGISVLRNLYTIMPHEDYIFYGDSKNAPYGTRSREDVQQLSLAVADKLVQQGVKAIVIACNTATSASCELLRAKYPELIIVGLEPALKPAVRHHQKGTVAVMATPLTLKQERYLTMKEQYEPEAKLIIDVPAPLLVEFVEKGELDSPAVMAYLKELLGDYLGRLDAVVLGCTHFPFIKPALRKLVGQHVFIIDGGPGAAHELSNQLVRHGLARTDDHVGEITFLNSKDSAKEIALSEKLFKIKL